MALGPTWYWTDRWPAPEGLLLVTSPSEGNTMRTWQGRGLFHQPCLHLGCVAPAGELHHHLHQREGHSAFLSLQEGKGERMFFSLHLISFLDWNGEFPPFFSWPCPSPFLPSFFPICSKTLLPHADLVNHLRWAPKNPAHGLSQACR